MKVGLVAELFHPVYSGPAVRFRRYLPVFRSMGVDVSVIAGTASELKTRMSGMQPSGAARGGHETPERVLGHPVFRAVLPDGPPEEREARFVAEIERHCAREAIDVLQLLWLPRAQPSLLDKLQARGLPLLYTMTMVKPLSANPARAFLQKRRRRSWLDRLDRIVVSSTAMRDELVRVGTCTDVSVIANGVDTSIFKPAPDAGGRLEIRNTLGIPEGARVVLFVGPLSPRKGIDLLLDAWATISSRHPEAHLLVVGPRRDLEDADLRGFSNRLRALESRSEAADRIHYTGVVPDVENYMKASDVFVFPSRREGMPNVVPEAMSTGLPVVCSHFDGFPAEFGRNGEQLLVVDHSPVSLSGTTSRLLKDLAEARRLGDAGRQWIHTTMPLETSVAAYVRAYKELFQTRGLVTGTTPRPSRT